MKISNSITITISASTCSSTLFWLVTVSIKTSAVSELIWACFPSRAILFSVEVHTNTFLFSWLLLLMLGEVVFVIKPRAYTVVDDTDTFTNLICGNFLVSIFNFSFAFCTYTYTMNYYSDFYVLYYNYPYLYFKEICQT